MQNLTIIELVEKMKLKEEDAFIEIYERFHTSFYYMALKLCKCDADAKDAVQETFIQIHKSIDTLQEPSILIVWMKKILFGKCKNIFRKNQKEVLMGNDAFLQLHIEEKREEYNPDLQVRHDAVNTVLLKLLDRIPYIYREPLILKYYGQNSMNEIAEILDIPVGTVKSRLYSGKKLLRKELKDYEAIEHEHLSFHSFSIGYALAGAFAMETGTTIPKRFSIKHSIAGGKAVSATAIKVVAASVITCGVAAPIAQQFLEQRNEQAVLPKQALHTQASGDQYAYYALKNWAHCKEDIEEKTASEFNQINDLYEQLKENQGVYWNLLQQDAWTETYEKLKK